ncbi:hypothetical protein [Streptomyces sp. GC420]|uniref:hypothetical protein n=1 Tax=Streptomyces sp. GC420 TaxID=2697568 RepID=UPI0014151AA0|nr:hypothetical protein [Streptomyces sp. GC420]
MTENTKPAADDNNDETPEVEAHSASVLDLQGTTAVNSDTVADGSCVSVISVVMSEK